MHGKGGRLSPRHFIAFLLCLMLALAAASQIQSAAQIQTGPGGLRGMRPPPPPLDLDLVLSYVTVTSSKNASPPRLSAADFHIFEDNVEQKIDYFAVQDQPVTVGIVWGAGTAFDDPTPDWSVRECPREFMKAMPSGSEYFVLSADSVTTSFTTDLKQIPINYARSGASTDTVYVGLDVLKEAANPRKILLVVTNPQGGGGGLLDRNYLERVVIRQGFQVHVATFSFQAGDANLEGLNFLAEIADLTGGSFYIGPPSNVFCRDLARELQVQYLIGFHPLNDARNGKWRKLGVKLDSRNDLKARIRRGYYANKQ